MTLTLESAKFELKYKICLVKRCINLTSAWLAYMSHAALPLESAKFEFKFKFSQSAGCGTRKHWQVFEVQCTHRGENIAFILQKSCAKNYIYINYYTVSGKKVPLYFCL